MPFHSLHIHFSFPSSLWTFALLKNAKKELKQSKKKWNKKFRADITSLQSKVHNDALRCALMPSISTETCQQTNDVRITTAKHNWMKRWWAAGSRRGKTQKRKQKKMKYSKFDIAFHFPFSSRLYCCGLRRSRGAFCCFPLIPTKHTQFLLHPLHNLLNRCLPASRCCSDTQMIMSSLLFSLLQHSTQPPHPHDPRFATPSLTSYVQHRSQFVHSSYSIHRSRAKYIRGGKKHSSRKSMIEWVRVERIAKLLKCLSWCFVNKMKLRDFFHRERVREFRGVEKSALDCVRFIEHRTIYTEYLCSTNTCERAKQLSSSSLPPFWAAAKLPLKNKRTVLLRFFTCGRDALLLLVCRVNSTS